MNRTLYRIWFLVIIWAIGGYWSCSTSSNSSKKAVVVQSWYHWQTQLQWDSLATYYTSHVQEIDRLYLHFFDVVWDKHRAEAMPTAVLHLLSAPPDSMPIVPTVYIANEALRQIPDTAIADLAQKLAQKIKKITQNHLACHPITEWQIDCDWTASTRIKYFDLLQKLTQYTQPQAVQLSATIRLHQVKYAKKTGVPPVAKGILMCYNTGDVRQAELENAILDFQTVQQYAAYLADYPLRLDIALPLFSWGAVYQKQQFKGLINGLCAADFSNTDYWEQKGGGRYTAKNNITKFGYSFQKGDYIRCDEIDIKLLKKTAQLLRQNIPNRDTIVVAFYHLESSILQRYTYEKITSIYSLF